MHSFRYFLVTCAHCHRFDWTNVNSSVDVNMCLNVNYNNTTFKRKKVRKRAKKTHIHETFPITMKCMYKCIWMNLSICVSFFLVLLEKHNVKTFSMLEQQNIKRIWKRVIVKWRFCILSNAPIHGGKVIKKLPIHTDWKPYCGNCCDCLLRFVVDEK